MSVLRKSVIITDLFKWKIPKNVKKYSKKGKYNGESNENGFKINVGNDVIMMSQ